MSDLSADAILAGLTTRFMGRDLVYLPTVSSTNDLARQLAAEGAPDGAMVVADYQSAGRGRLARRWEAPPGSSLLLSLVLRPALAASRAQQLTLLSGLSAVDAIEATTGLRAGLKWPNDVMISNAKAGGILTEVELRGDQVAYAVVGLGLNVNLDPVQLPQPLVARATSLSFALGRPVARLPLLWALLERMEARYLALRAGETGLEVEWAQRLVNLERKVLVVLGDRTFEGVAVGVDPDGALLVRRANGTMERVVAGDVTNRD